MNTNIKYIISEAIDMVVAKKWIDEELIIGNNFLSQYGLSVVFNAKYNFDGYYRNCLAIYQNGSVKNKGRIRIGINFPLMETMIKKRDLKSQIKISIWHEIGHGIVQYLKGLRRKDTQCGTKIFRGNMLNDFRNIINDEEYYVEEFGYVMSDKGIFSVIEDFLADYENEILTLKNQEGGSKWMQQFITK
jgi:hypothetical protein